MSGGGGSSAPDGEAFIRGQMRRMDGMNRVRAGLFKQGRTKSLAMLAGLVGLVTGIYSFTLLRMRQDDLASDPDFNAVPSALLDAVAEPPPERRQ